jgi:hypothetical protein
MVFVWGRGGGGPRRRRGWGGQRGHGYGGYGRGYGRGYGPLPGYGYRRNDSCLRDLLFLNTGCCLANAIGCSADLMLVAPTTAREVRSAGTGGGRVRDRLVAAVRVYQREVSPRRRALLPLHAHLLGVRRPGAGGARGAAGDLADGAAAAALPARRRRRRRPGARLTVLGVGAPTRSRTRSTPLSGGRG